MVESSASEHDRLVALISDLLATHFHVDPQRLTAGLIGQGIIDSADFMELFMLLEDRFGLEISAADLTLRNFENCESIARFVSEKRAMPL